MSAEFSSSFEEGWYVARKRAKKTHHRDRSLIKTHSSLRSHQLPNILHLIKGSSLVVGIHERSVAPNSEDVFVDLLHRLTDRSNREEMVKSKGFQFQEDLMRRGRCCRVEFSPILGVESRVDLEEVGERWMRVTKRVADSRLVGEEELEEGSRMWSRS